MNGAVIGLVAITPNAGYVEAAPSLAIGAITVLICYGCSYLKEKYFATYFPNFDDSLDAFTAHGIGGSVGTGLVGWFCTAKANPSVVREGILYGGGGLQFGIQLAAVASIWVLSIVVSTVTLLALKYTMGVIVDQETAERGLDAVEHGEEDELD